MKNYSAYFLALFFVLLFCNIKSQSDGGIQLRNTRSNPVYKTRFAVSPVIGIYKTNKNHTAKPQQKLAFNVSVKEEIRLNKKTTSFLLIGVEYSFHGLNFNSYYFYNDSLKLYNGNMSAKYQLQINEIDIPIQIKQSFQKENNAHISAYVYAGYVYRILASANLKVSNNGAEKFNASEHLKFKNPIFKANDNSFLCFAGGVQKNTLMRHNALFAELQLRYALSPFYFSESFAPTNLVVNSHFVMLTVGIKL